MSKRDTIRMATVLTSAMLACACAAANTAPAERAPRVVELMHKSGLWKQIAQVEPQMQAGAAQARTQGKGKEGMDGLDYLRFRSAIATAYAPDVLRREFMKLLDAGLAPEDQERALEWLSSSPGTQFTELEERGGEVAEILRREREAQAFFETLAPERAERLRRLARSIRVGEASAALMIDTTLAITYGMVLSTPDADMGLVEAMRSRMEAQRPQMVKMLEERSVAEFADMYRSMPDAALDQYLVFADSPAGQRYHEATTKAFDAVLSRASLEMGRALGRIRPEPRRRS